MEIKRIDNEVINEYPKMNELNKKDLKKYVPKKWTKIGVTTLIFSIIMKATKVKATTPRIGNVTFPDGIELGGGVRRYNPVYLYLQTGSNIFKITSILLLAISAICSIVKKCKNKQEKDTKLTNKRMKILYIVTSISILICVVLTILSRVVNKF